MSEYYTTKQVQDLFKVDRITVYRMLQDGRLKGVKIGKQWRFHKSEIDRLLSGEPVSVEIDPEGNKVFPVHCVQTIQDLFSSVSKMSALIVDLSGTPVTKISRTHRFCELIMSSPDGKTACQTCWRESAKQKPVTNQSFTCHAGLNYVGTTILHNQEPQGLFLMGQVYLEKPVQSEADLLYHQLAEKYNLSESELKQAAAEIPVLVGEDKNHLRQQPSAAAKAVESIFTERSAFLKRLQEIANLTQNI